MGADHVLFISLDSCRYDTFAAAHAAGTLPNLAAVAPLHCAQAPSHFTYASHAAFWMGFTPGVEGSSEPLLNPKAGKLFRMAYTGHAGLDAEGFRLDGANVIDGFRRQGYRTIGSGAVEWFNPTTETGAVLGEPFENFHFAGNTWSLPDQLTWLAEQMDAMPADQPLFVFLNVGETHVPYWHAGALWDREDNPCVPFQRNSFERRRTCRRRQRACLEYVDTQLKSLLDGFQSATTVVTADHGDCWGEDGLWEHGISHRRTLEVPLLMRVRGVSMA